MIKHSNNDKTHHKLKKIRLETINSEHAEIKSSHFDESRDGETAEKGRRPKTLSAKAPKSWATLILMSEQRNPSASNNSRTLVGLCGLTLLNLDPELIADPCTRVVLVSKTYYISIIAMLLYGKINLSSGSGFMGFSPIRRNGVLRIECEIKGAEPVSGLFFFISENRCFIFLLYGIHKNPIPYV